MAKVFPVIGSALKDAAIVHHSPFDRTALSRAAAKYGTGELHVFGLITYRLPAERGIASAMMAAMVSPISRGLSLRI